jgi:transposase InsO family protein
MNTKDEIFAKIQEFKALVENHIGKKIKILKLDNGGEYTSKDFDAFCKDARIKKALTAPCKPQQNRVAERKKMSIIVT